ncbi:putative baseplate assembly protein [Paenibacillus thalictri]|uniref:Putative baseplate assembly protein n=1 Tax=Paenibacillus thalictri TaxID=2527873 RepID=A0A4Q9DY53_9BACL|nr:putative baseplate assembly protein [Paenibacillus thalictri]TBL80768.1 putative baseplate assembly protein [Paenibacillus thalictri]
MLPLPNLDDRTFEQLVREMRDLIPGIMPEWTDENAHDPGITLLEMLAWHIEMQQYHLDRVTDGHERKFLKLLGEAPLERQAASTSISFSGAPHPILIPLGTLLRVGELPFETVRPVTVLADSNWRVFVHSEDGVREIADDFESGSAPFFSFGSKGEAGTSMELVCDRPLPVQMPLSLWFELANRQPDYRIPARYGGFIPSARVDWLYWREIEAGEGSWELIDMERDESYGLHQSGPILFQLPEDAGQVYRLMARFSEGIYDDPPRISRLIWNEVFAAQVETHCIEERFDHTAKAVRSDDEQDPAEEEPPAFTLRHALFLHGLVYVQFKLEDGGWIDIEPDRYTVHRVEGKAWLSFNGETQLPEGERCIRAIAVIPSFDERTKLGRGTGISAQTVAVNNKLMLADQLRLQVGWYADDSSQIVWYDWERVADFDQSSPDSYHYMVDGENGVIRFSDGLHGAVPPAMPFPNIRIIGFRSGGGAAGNVMADKIRETDLTYPLQVTNLYPAYGGAEAETVKEAMNRVKRMVLEPKCGVTADDIERLVKEIPGLRVVRVKALPGYKPALRSHAEERSLGSISVVVVPYSNRPCPLPSDGMIQTIRVHLEPYRLLTTTLYVIPPEYVKITVRAVIVIDPRYEGRETDVVQALKQWLQPYGDDGSSEGWDFGRTVHKSDVYDIVHRVPGVLYIQDVWLMAEGNNVLREEGGDIRIPPNGLAVSGEHEIEFITSNR